VKLYLEDGTVLTGKSFGCPDTVGGEVVFNTGMTGYVETLTDPSYKGQILVCTYPLQGNYGVPVAKKIEGFDWPHESSGIQVQGLVVSRHSEQHSHHDAEMSLGQWLNQHGIPAMEGVDTRVLTRRLREKGTMRGWLVHNDVDLDQVKNSARSIEMKKVVDIVSCESTRQYEGKSLSVAVVDCGCKNNILRSFAKRNIGIQVVPWNYDLAGIYESVDGFFISNGPGDPKDADVLIKNVAALLKREKPVFGICLGHQILALACGADTYKLPYGHRSQNQPVQDVYTRRCYVTSQNHGYAVDMESLPDNWDVWFVNLNDETNEGIRCLDAPFASVQFHPEASPGPTDTGYLFDEFVRMLGHARMNSAR